jgi:hypothetical protein
MHREGRHEANHSEDVQYLLPHRTIADSGWNSFRPRWRSRDLTGRLGRNQIGRHRCRYHHFNSARQLDHHRRANITLVLARAIANDGFHKGRRHRVATELVPPLIDQARRDVVPAGTAATQAPEEKASVKMRDRSSLIHLRRRSWPLKTVTWLTWSAGTKSLTGGRRVVSALPYGFHARCNGIAANWT